MATDGFRNFSSDTSKANAQAHVYYCSLCDEVLVFSENLVKLLKIRLIYDDKCPGCGFELERALSCEAYQARTTNGFFDMKLRKPDSRPSLTVSRVPDGGELRARTSNKDAITEAATIDRILRSSGLVVLTGPTGHALSPLFCVKAQLPEPLGSNSHVVWIDGGNVFDSYAISGYAAEYHVDRDKVHRRIRLARAFTYHQVHALIQKLPSELERFRARLAVVSDMTLLYCDPDVRDKDDALDTFKGDVRFLRELAEKRKALVVVTVLRPRNNVMDSLLLGASHAEPFVHHLHDH